jgi:glucose-6-phosphate dehydrogenase assembly protein OpcA
MTTMASTTPGGDGTGPDLGGLVMSQRPMVPGEPVLRWSSRAHTIDDIEQELARIWASPRLVAVVAGIEERHVAARTSVLNLVVVARRQEIAERSAATIQQLVGKHPSRTLILSPADPDGPSWLDAQIQAHCVLPREDAAETCAEMIYLTAGGEAGRHPEAIVAPLLIHDLPVTVWWPGEPLFKSPAAQDLFDMSDSLVVDGSAWSGDGLHRLVEAAAVMDSSRLVVRDFALVRQSRWREAIASVFDMPDFTPFLRSFRRIAVTYATHDETGAPGSTNVIKPVYHVAWLGSRLGMTVVKPLAPIDKPSASTSRKAPVRPGQRSTAGAKPSVSRGLVAALRQGSTDVAVVVRPVVSKMPAGTTLRVEILAERRGTELRADITAEAETVHVRVWTDGVECLDRMFRAARRTEADLLAEAIEAGRSDPVGRDAIRFAAKLAAAS